MIIRGESLSVELEKLLLNHSLEGEEKNSILPKRRRKENEKEKKKFSWSSLVYNNRLMLALSFVAAFCIWIVMMYNNTDINQTWKIDNVPITVEYTTGAVENGLKVYNLSRNAVSVSISGNSLAIRQVKAENIEVVATVTESMANEQNNTLTLSARKKGKYWLIFPLPALTQAQ